MGNPTIPLTRDEILALPAGRELDALLAEHVMGWGQVQPDCYVHDGKDWCGTDPNGGGYYGDTGRKIVPHFSSDIAAAWQVVERLRLDWSEFHLSRGPRGWSCLLADSLTRRPHIEVCNCDAASLAVCRAALLAVRKEAAS